jgi:hypothetical protein
MPGRRFLFFSGAPPRTPPGRCPGPAGGMIPPDPCDGGVRIMITDVTAFFRHPGESRGPVSPQKDWVPAFAGMTNAGRRGVTVTSMPPRPRRGGCSESGKAPIAIGPDYRMPADPWPLACVFSGSYERIVSDDRAERMDGRGGARAIRFDRISGGFMIGACGKQAEAGFCDRL